MNTFVIKLTAIILNYVMYSYCYVFTMSLQDKSHNKLKLSRKPPLPDSRLCEICKEKINVKSTIPYNCSIPLGCPYNKKTQFNIEDSFSFRG